MKKALSVIMTLTLVICIILSPALFEHNHVHAIPYTPGTMYNCPNCGGVNTAMMMDVIQPTCIDSGEYTYSCSNCGLHTVYVDALGHNYQWAGAGQDATCTQPGWAYYRCSRCGVESTGTLQALGHDYKSEVTKEPSCEEEGVEVYTCTRCGDHHEEAIEALGHDFVHKEKEATCTEEGFTGDVCSRCGKEEVKTVPALGHSYSQSWTIREQPTYFKKGLKTKTCSRCGDVLKEEIPALISPIVIGGVVGGLVLLGIVIGFLMKKKAAGGIAAGAAGAGVKAAELVVKEAKKIGKPKFKTRTLLLCTKDEKLIETLKGKDYFKVKTCSYDELLEKTADVEPDVLIADVTNDVVLREITEAMEEPLKETKIGLIACKDLSEAGRERLAKLANEEKIIDFVEEGVSPYVAMVELVLPVMKPDLKSDETLTNIGTVADALGIPGISKIIDVYLAGKDIKETLEEEELGISEDATIIGDIASILGLEKLESVAGLVGDVEAIKKALDKETGAYEEKKGRAAVKDIAEVVSDLADD